MAIKTETDWIDKRADVAAVLAHSVRRQVRDLLRHSDPLTLTEIARSIGQSEQNTYHHLSKMLEAGIITKRSTKINGRLITLYTLSDYYNDLFSDVERKRDVLPVYVLFGVYSALMILSVLLPSYVIAFYSAFGIKSIHSAVAVNLAGFVTTATILLYYIVPELIKRIGEVKNG